MPIVLDAPPGPAVRAAPGPPRHPTPPAPFPALDRAHTSWTRRCASCGAPLFKRSLERPVACGCGRWIWD
jgi:hypothetical protein